MEEVIALPTYLLLLGPMCILLVLVLLGCRSNRPDD